LRQLAGEKDADGDEHEHKNGGNRTDRIADLAARCLTGPLEIADRLVTVHGDGHAGFMVVAAGDIREVLKQQGIADFRQERFLDQRNGDDYARRAVGKGKVIGFGHNRHGADETRLAGNIAHVRGIDRRQFALFDILHLVAVGGRAPDGLVANARLGNKIACRLQDFLACERRHDFVFGGHQDQVVLAVDDQCPVVMKVEPHLSGDFMRELVVDAVIDLYFGGGLVVDGDKGLVPRLQFEAVFQGFRHQRTLVAQGQFVGAVRGADEEIRHGEDAAG